MLSQESQNAEKPFVMGTHYNGSETSSYHTSGNDKKVIHTRSGHTIIMDDSEGKMSITILDISGNTVYMDTVAKNITITAPETMPLNCNNMNINVIQNMNTNVGMNKSDSIGMNHTESVEMMKNLFVGMNFMTNVVGKMVEFIKGNKESKVEKDHIKTSNGKIISQSEGNQEHHSAKGVHNNSAEKSKNF